MSKKAVVCWQTTVPEIPWMCTPVMTLEAATEDCRQSNERRHQEPEAGYPLAFVYDEDTEMFRDCIKSLESGKTLELGTDGIPDPAPTVN